MMASDIAAATTRRTGSEKNRSSVRASSRPSGPATTGPGTLIEAKADHPNFIDKQTGMFKQ